MVLLASAGVASAHGGHPGLVAEPNPVPPGGTVEIRGDNLGSDEAVTVVLVVDGRGLVIANGTTDGVGHLTLITTIPATLPAARYTMQALAAGGYAADGSIELAGVSLAEPGGAGDPYERGPIGEPPVPATPVPAAAGGGQPVFIDLPASVTGNQATAVTDLAILGVALLIPLAIAAILIGRRRRAVTVR
jgi:hypothetical protein